MNMSRVVTLWPSIKYVSFLDDLFLSLVIPKVGVGGYGTIGLGPAGMTNGMRPVMGHNSIMNGRGGMASLARDQVMNHQQDLSSQLLSGLGGVNGFSNLQFDWKPSP